MSSKVPLNQSQLQQIRDDSDLVFSRAEITTAVGQMARAADQLLTGTDPIIMAVMNGGMILTAEISLALKTYSRIDYLQVARYQDKTVGGQLHWHKQPQYDLAGETVLLVDDIFDEGETLQELIAYCQAQGAKQIYTAVLLYKNKQQRKHDLIPDVIGLEVADRFVYGYGMDYQGYFRDLSDIYALREV
jgi:hypoxanthine phosphoribosyltransferase|tara:strand:+ start:4157 stop:4723 length:567 start_codon:yes stop_codon:yes gene_type:complete